MSKKKRIRIKDIAADAQVSRGTVDRVLHNRGRVAPDVKAKIDKTIEKLGYSPNIIASTLAKNKEYHIATLLPSPDMDNYWALPQIGIERALKASKDFGIHVDQFFYIMENVNSFKEQADLLIQSNPDAILLSAEFYRESLSFYKKVANLNIPLLSINTHIPTLEKVSYIGQHSYQSGKLAGRIFDIALRNKGDILMLHLGSSVDNAPHIMDKERGLSDYFQTKTNPYNILKEEFEDYANIDRLTTFLYNIFESTKNIAGIFVTNSRSYYLVQALELLGYHDLCIVGFDLLEENCQLLKNGKIDFLINQDPIKQGNLGILNLVDSLLYQRSNLKTLYLPLDIVVAENVDLYMQNEIETFVTL